MLQKINFSWRVKIIIFFVAIILVNVMTWLITSINQKAGLYPVDADSIGMPIIFTAGASLFMLSVFIIISLISKKISFFGLKLEGLTRTIAIRIPLLLIYIFSFLLAMYGVVYWSYPGHYSIAASYFILCGVLLTGFSDWRKTPRQ